MKIALDLDITEADALLSMLGSTKISECKSDRDAELIYSVYRALKDCLDKLEKI